MTLENQISAAKSSTELELVIKSIAKQKENGFENSLAHHLGDAFWYIDLEDNLEAQKKWMLNVCTSYGETFKVMN